MTLKLTYDNAEALFNLFNNAVLIDQPADLDQKLIMAHMIAIYKKLRTKWEGENKKAYTINMTVPEAIAYRIYWRDNDYSKAVYEWAFLLNHCSQIDRELNITPRISQSYINLLN